MQLHFVKKQFIMRLVWVVSGLCGAAIQLYAQESVEHALRGKVYDADALDPLPGATVQLFDSTQVCVKGKVTNEDGTFYLEKISPGIYLLKISFLGYQPYSVRIDCRRGKKLGRIKDVLLREAVIEIGETKVVAQGREFVMRQDTLVYYADYYKQSAGARMAEMWRRMPGVWQDGEQDWRINGKRVSRILVNGKEFFGDNWNEALKLLPADLIREIKVYDKKSKESDWTGVDDGSRETVIDLAMDEALKNSWAGEVEAAGGSSKRYLGRASLNQFMENRFMSLMAQAGNDSQLGDDNSQNVGWNFNRSTTKISVGGNLSLYHNVMQQESSAGLQQFDNTAAPYTESNHRMRNTSLNTNTNFNVEWRPDSMTLIAFSPSFNHSKGNGEQTSTAASFSSDPYDVAGVEHPWEDCFGLLRPLAVNANQGNAYSKSGLWNVQTALDVTRRFKKKGRSLIFSSGWSRNHSNHDANESRLVRYFKLKNQEDGDSVYKQKQLEQINSEGSVWRTRLTYTEPLSTDWVMMLTYHLSRSKQDDRMFRTSVSDTLAGLQRKRDTENRIWEQQAELAFLWQRTKFQLQAGAMLYAHHNQYAYQVDEKKRNYAKTTKNWAPKVNFFYHLSASEHINVAYHAMPRAVNASELMPDTLEQADPLNIRLGNPNLKPSFTHSVNMGYSRYDERHFRSYNVNMGFFIIQNAISSESSYDAQTGCRTSIPVNVQGNANGFFDFLMSTPLRNNRFTLFLQANATYMRYNSMQYTTNQWVFRPMSRVNYRRDLFDLSVYLGGNYDCSQNTQLRASGYMQSYHIDAGCSGSVRFTFGMDLSTDFSFLYRRGFRGSEMNAKEYVWNVGLAQSFLKGKKARIALKAYDLLNGRNPVNRSFSSQARSDVRYKAFGRYVMLHLSYNFNVMGK